MQRDPNQAPTSVNPATEKHYRVQELVKPWGLSDWTIRRMFQNEPDVLRIGGKKRLVLSIPESVALRVHATFCQQPLQTELPR